MRAKFFLPLVLFAGLVAVFLFGLRLDPSRVPSPLLDRPVPAFALPDLEGGEDGLKTADFLGGPTLVNFFASWCLPCLAEHPLLLRLGHEGRVRIFGVAYKDKPEDTARWLAERGNPYDRIGVDRTGRAAIEWGVYGVPESYLVDGEGRIRWKHVGVLTPEVWEEDFLPRLEGVGK